MRHPHHGFFFVERPLGRSMQPPLIRPADYREFEEWLGRKLDLPVVAYTVLPGGWQAVVGPTSTDRLARCLLGVAHSHPGPPLPIHSRGLPTVGELVQAARAVERRALSAGLVRRAQDWPWASLASRADATPVIRLVTAPFLLTRTWTDFVNQPGSVDRSSLDDAQLPGRLS